MKPLIFLVLVFLLPILKLEGALEYRVMFSGIQRQEIVDLLKDASQLNVKKNTPQTLSSLRKRAEKDIPHLIKALQSQAYYQAKIHVELNNTSAQPIEVIYHVDSGPVYPLAEFNISPECLGVTPQELSIALHQPALPKNILRAENALIELLKHRGYPLAAIAQRKVIADQKQQHILVTIEVDIGPLLSFGKSEIIGNKQVAESFIRKKICWKENDRYDPHQIEETIQEIEATGLFRSVEIVHSEDPTENNTLPITIDVAEAKHRSLAFGLGYSTQRGPGITGQWQHRNYWGNGERFYINANLLQQTQEAACSYTIPDFLSCRQDLLLKTEWQHKDTEGFCSTSFSLSGLLERQLSEQARLSIGGKYEYLNNDDSDNNGNFHLLKVPTQWKWSNVDDPLDPISGATLFFKIVPTTQLLGPRFVYAKSTFTGSIYYPLSSDRHFVVAAKMHLGSIIGSGRREIPPSERFYAGSENTLRGYSYYTVSPLKDGDPIGGRSLMTFSLEGRWRATEKWGGVLFYDAGNVYSPSFPQLNKKVLQSVGGGLRYYTPVGPLRLDIAFPLNRRRSLDKAFQVYFSIGQSF
ncbi:MAG: BamA/TamA family outer membrane protein [Waddliaceae bacterium]